MIRLMQGPLLTEHGPFLTEEGALRRPVFNGQVECPVHEYADLEKCTACPHLVRFESEELEGIEQVVVVCGYDARAESGPG